MIGSYFPSATASVPDEEPSMNSIGGGNKLLNASISFEGRYCNGSSEVCFGENPAGAGKRGEAASIIVDQRLEVEDEAKKPV